MSYSPPIRRLSTAASSREELINAYEAEEERIINVLSRKLEQLRQEKIGLENVLEAESESHVNRLSRELSALRIAQHQLQSSSSSSSHHPHPGSSSSLLADDGSSISSSSAFGGGVLNGAISSSNGSSNNNLVFSLSPETRVGLQAYAGRGNPLEPSAEVMLDAMKRENEQLRSRLSETEREFIRISRMNDIYREELIEHRRRAGLSVDDLIGMPAPDPLSQPTHRRQSVSYSTGSSPTTSIFHSSRPPHHSNGVPIPRPPSQIHRPTARPPTDLTGNTTPLSHSPSSSSDSPFPFSPPTSASAGLFSATTNITSPPSSASFHQQQLMAVGAGSIGRGLTYPSVPPPSLSSSFGSPSISYHMPPRDPSLSPIEPLSRRNSNAQRRGSVDRSRGGSRRASLDFGARVAETGTLVPRGGPNRGAVDAEASGVQGRGGAAR